jgi:hypothetical protein
VPASKLHFRFVFVLLFAAAVSNLWEQPEKAYLDQVHSPLDRAASTNHNVPLDGVERYTMMGGIPL